MCSLGVSFVVKLSSSETRSYSTAFKSTISAMAWSVVCVSPVSPTTEVGGGTSTPYGVGLSISTAGIMGVCFTCTCRCFRGRAFLAVVVPRPRRLREGVVVRQSVFGM